MIAAGVGVGVGVDDTTGVGVCTEEGPGEEIGELEAETADGVEATGDGLVTGEDGIALVTIAIPEFSQYETFQD